MNIKQYGNTSFLLFSVWLVSDAMPSEYEMWLHILSMNVSSVEYWAKLKYWRFKHKLLALFKKNSCTRCVIHSTDYKTSSMEVNKTISLCLLFKANFSHKIAEKTTIVQYCGAFVIKKGKNDEILNPMSPWSANEAKF